MKKSILRAILPSGQDALHVSVPKNVGLLCGDGRYHGNHHLVSVTREKADSFSQRGISRGDLANELSRRADVFTFLMTAYTPFQQESRASKRFLSTSVTSCGC